MTDTARPASGLVVPPFRPDADGTHPPLDCPDYKSTRLRHPSHPLVPLPAQLTELTAPRLRRPTASASPTTTSPRQHEGEPLGERIIVYGQVLDDDGRAVPDTLVEIWQANAAGRYRHAGDQHPAPLDPNFTGAGRCLTDADGRFRFITDQARRLPVGQPPQRVAAGAHPLLALRAGVRAAPRDADVLPRRPAVLPGPDLQLGARPGGARAA